MKTFEIKIKMMIIQIQHLITNAGIKFLKILLNILKTKLIYFKNMNSHDQKFYSN